jgi:hypothetical protein
VFLTADKAVSGQLLFCGAVSDNDLCLQRKRIVRVCFVERRKHTCGSEAVLCASRYEFLLLLMLQVITVLCIGNVLGRV